MREQWFKRTRSPSPRTGLTSGSLRFLAQIAKELIPLDAVNCALAAQAELRNEGTLALYR